MVIGPKDKTNDQVGCCVCQPPEQETAAQFRQRPSGGIRRHLTTCASAARPGEAAAIPKPIKRGGRAFQASAAASACYAALSSALPHVHSWCTSSATRGLRTALPLPQTIPDHTLNAIRIGFRTPYSPHFRFGNADIAGDLESGNDIAFAINDFPPTSRRGR